MLGCLPRHNVPTSFGGVVANQTISLTSYHGAPYVHGTPASFRLL